MYSSISGRIDEFGREAERALCKDRAAEVITFEAHVKRMKGVEEVVRVNPQFGRMADTDLAATRYYLAEAEIWLAKLKPGK